MNKKTRERKGRQWQVGAGKGKRGEVDNEYRDWEGGGWGGGGGGGGKRGGAMGLREGGRGGGGGRGEGG